MSARGRPRHLTAPPRLRRGLILALLGVALAAPAAQASIVGSKHDLSMTGGGYWGSYDEDQVCVFCHTPHGASSVAPLWNRGSTPGTYQVYGSDTLDSVMQQPSGESLLCLSCHDGVTALNMLLNPGQSGTHMDPAGDQLGDIYYPGSPYGQSMNIGGGYPANPTARSTADDHPSSFVFDAALVAADGALRLPPPGDAVTLRGPDANRVECTSCHDVHDPSNGAFLVKSNAGSQLCLTCHVK